MRALQPREVRLARITLIVLFLGVTYLIVDRQQTRHGELREQWLTARLEEARQRTLLQREPELRNQLSEIRAELPVHPLDQDLKSLFARQVENLSQASGLQITSVTPRPEEALEDLDVYQSTLRCTWEGTSEQLVEFLVRLHDLGAVADISELRIQNRNGLAESLSGSLMLDFVYTREDLPAGTPPE